MSFLHLLGSSMIRGAFNIPGMDSLLSWQFKKNRLSYSASIFLEDSTTLLKSESFDLEPNSEIHIISFALGLLALESSVSSSNHDQGLV